VLAELLAHEGVVESCDLRGSFGFMAIHGGSLERATAEVARAAAERCGASLYAVEQPEDFQWHIPSHRHDPADAPRLAAFLDHVDHVISVHGYGRDGWWTRLLLGGRDRDFADRTARVLRAHLDGFEVIDEIADIPRELRGLHPENPVNCPGTAGVQLELPPRVRGLGPNGRPEYVDQLVTALAAVYA